MQHSRGGQPSFSLLLEVQVWFTCVFGSEDPLINAENREVFADAL